jgi:ribosome-associated toxin RatA of RatAB toxin-antitoxin module
MTQLPVVRWHQSPFRQLFGWQFGSLGQSAVHIPMWQSFDGQSVLSVHVLPAVLHIVAGSVGDA